MKQKLLDLIGRCAAREVLRLVVFSRPKSKDEARKVSVRPVVHRTQRFFAVEYTKGDTVAQKNLKFDEASEALDALCDAYLQINLMTSLGDAELKVSKSAKTVLLGADALERKLSGDIGAFALPLAELERKKNYILKGNEPFLITLGISDKNGRVHDKKQGKFRQINRFLEYFRKVYENLPAEGVLNIYDLCSGKSYLSFAVYHYLTVMLHREVRMLAIDLKADVIRSCDGYAKELGFSGMHFICDDIKNTPRDEVVHLVISLHACDVATDIVLHRAAELSARVILSTPCCHRALSRLVNQEALRFVTRYGKLSDKLCEALTDGLRLLYLEGEGYSTSAYELVDPDDTPKNTLLVAIKKKESDEQKRMAYANTLRYVLGEKADSYLNGLI